MEDVTLPCFLNPELSNNLTRLGKDNDGGYLVNKQDVEDSSHLVSFGICDDWSFEKQFLKVKDIPLVAFDGSLTNRFWLKKSILSLFSGKVFNILKYICFKSFFSKKNKKFVRSFVGLKQHPSFVAFKDALEYIGGVKGKKVFFKIDIEGWEYRILEDIMAVSENISGMVIEFHDIDLHIERLENFVNSFPLNIIHVHANNYGPIAENKLPHTIEITFSSLSSNLPGFVNMPHALDQPNDPGRPEYKISIFR